MHLIIILGILSTPGISRIMSFQCFALNVAENEDKALFNLPKITREISKS